MGPFDFFINYLKIGIRDVKLKAIVAAVYITQDELDDINRNGNPREIAALKADTFKRLKKEVNRILK